MINAAEFRIILTRLWAGMQRQGGASMSPLITDGDIVLVDMSKNVPEGLVTTDWLLTGAPLRLDDFTLIPLIPAALFASGLTASYNFRFFDAFGFTYILALFSYILGYAFGRSDMKDFYEKDKALNRKIDKEFIERETETQPSQR